MARGGGAGRGGKGARCGTSGRGVTSGRGGKGQGMVQLNSGTGQVLANKISDIRSEARSEENIAETRSEVRLEDHIIDTGSGLGLENRLLETRSEVRLEDDILHTTDENTESSQHQTRGSNTTPNHQSPRQTIVPYGNMFTYQKVGTQIVDIFKQLFGGCWPTWKKVPKENRKMMWERFQKTYQWDPEFDEKVRANWEFIMEKRYRDVMSEAREESKKMARAKGVTVENDLSVLKPYFPEWMDETSWAAMIDSLWNTDAWKKMSASNKINRCTLIEGQMSGHSGGSRSFLHHKLHMEKEKNGLVSFLDLYEDLHTMKRKPSEQLSGGASKRFTTRKAENILGKYKELELETFGVNTDDHPFETDKELWTKACGGVKKGNLFGMPDETLLSSKSCMSSTGRSYTPNTVTTSEVQKLQDELEKQKKKTDEGEKKVALLEERDKEREKAMEKLMEQVALLTKAVTGNLPPNSS